MKRQLVFALMFLSLVTVSAQDSPPKKKIFYKMELKEVSGLYKYGYLTNITDEHIYFSQQKINFGRSLQTRNKSMAYTNVAQLKLRKKGAAGRTALVGGAIGVGVGILAGFIEGDDPEGYWLRFSAGDKAILYGISAGAGGSLIGFIIGSIAHKKFIIGGNRERYKEMKFNILEKVYGASQASAAVK